MDRRYKKKMERYWDRELKRSLEYLDDLDFSDWFDYWHLHPDWYGKGNRFFENRRAVSKSTYELFVSAQGRLRSRANPYQLWATICTDTSDNAVFIHTENGNGTSFPHKFEGVMWEVEPPEELDEIIDFAEYKLGRGTYEDAPVYIITRKA